MEHLHVLINGIDDIKEHLTDSDYLKLMNAIGKLGEIIDSQSSEELESVYEDSDEELDNDNLSENSDDSNISEPQEEFEHIDIDLLLETIHNNELLFTTFMNEKNLSEDFINSKFNVINRNAYNYITNKTCNCTNDYDLCIDTDLVNCKNYLKYILKFPLIHIITRDCENCIRSVCNDINKYNLISFDFSINTLNNTQGEIFGKYSNSLMNIINNVSSKNKALIFINLFSYLFENGHLLVENEDLKECCCNKLLNGDYSMTFREIPYWSDLLNFNPNIINIMINNLIELH